MNKAIGLFVFVGAGSLLRALAHGDSGFGFAGVAALIVAVVLVAYQANEKG